MISMLYSNYYIQSGDMNMATNKSPFTLRLDDDIREKIGYLANRDNRSVTNYIQNVLKRHIREIENQEGALPVGNHSSDK